MQEKSEYIYPNTNKKHGTIQEKRKGKSIPAQAWEFQEVEDTRFHDSRPKEGGDVSPMHRPPLLPSKYSW